MSQMGSTTSIVIIDDHAIVRAGLRMLIETRPGCQVVGEASNSKCGLRTVAENQPDLVLLDLDLQDESGLELLPELLRVAPDTRVLILTGLKDADTHSEAVCRGAMGVVSKDRAAEDLLLAIEAVGRGEAWLSPDVTARVLKAMRHRNSPAPDPEAERIKTLSKREMELIPLVAQGLRNKQIGERLFISEATVRHHLTSIFAKLGIEDRLELIVLCHRRGLTASRPEN